MIFYYYFLYYIDLIFIILKLTNMYEREVMEQNLAKLLGQE